MSSAWLPLAIFVSITLGVIALGSLLCELLWRQQSRIDERLKQEFRTKVRQRAEESSLFRDLEQLASGGDAAQAQLADRLQAFVAQAGLTWSLERIVGLSAAVAGVAFIALWLLSGWLWLGLMGGLAVCVLSVVYVHGARQRRMNRLCLQLPEAFEVMSRALRAGQTVPVAFQMVANEFPLPIAEEFAHCYEQQHLGIPYEVALRDMARRTGFVETQIFAVALIVNRQVGGNLADLLATLAQTLRKRSRFSARVRALTGEGRMQARVLIALPLVALAALFWLDPHYAQLLLDRPKLLALTGVSQLIGAVCIRQIVNLKF